MRSATLAPVPPVRVRRRCARRTRTSRCRPGTRRGRDRAAARWLRLRVRHRARKFAVVAPVRRERDDERPGPTRPLRRQRQLEVAPATPAAGHRDRRFTAVEQRRPGARGPQVAHHPRAHGARAPPPASPSRRCGVPPAARRRRHRAQRDRVRHQRHVVHPFEDSAAPSASRPARAAQPRRPRPGRSGAAPSSASPTVVGSRAVGPDATEVTSPPGHVGEDQGHDARGVGVPRQEAAAGQRRSACGRC